jgi:hypothetical protein
LLDLIVVLIASLLCGSGCAGLLPQGRTATKSKWSSFEEAKAAFERIVPNETRTEELARIGFDPEANPNVKILTYLDLIQRFMPNPSITKEDLDAEVRACIEAREKSQAWEIELSEIKTRRFGNVLLDMTGFIKKTHETGWRFNGLLLIREGRVVYKLSSGQPSVDRNERKIKPLGPLQEIDSVLTGFARP